MNRDNKNNTSNRNDNDEQFPGYPHYPAQEDITQPNNNNGKVNADDGTISLPDVRDIPGQGDIVPPSLGEMADTTISSADEEDLVSGDSLDNLDNDDDDVKIVMGTEADVTAEDLQMLGALDEDMDMGEDEDLNSKLGGLDATDEEGVPLNEGSGHSISSVGDDLDVPGSEDDDANESLGEEDEENNYYSLGRNDDNSTD